MVFRVTANRVAHGTEKNKDHTYNGKETKKSERTLCGDKIFSYCYTDSIFSPYNARFARACLNARVSFPHLYIYIIFYIYNFFYAE